MPNKENIIVPETKLSKEQIDELEKLDPLVSEARRSLNALKRLGMNVAVLEDKLNWAEDVGKVLKEEFT